MIARRALLSLAAVFVSAGVGSAMIGHASPAADAETTAPTPFHGAQIVAMRRLTEAQYRNSIADIFGPDVIPVGRFEPIVRSAHQLIASGATSASISPTGLEQFDIIARGVAAQVFDTRHRDTFVPCKPAKSDGADPACADLTLTAIGRFVLRRPLTASERSSYLSMADAAAQNAGSFTGGLELALSAMLVSPEFLYVIEKWGTGSLETRKIVSEIVV